MIQFKSTKSVQYGKPGSSKVHSGIVKLTIERVVPPLEAQGEVRIFGSWTPINNNSNVLVNLSEKHYTVAQIESIEQNLPALTETQYLFRNFEPRIIQFVKALLDFEHQQDPEANFGLTSADMEIEQ